MSVTLDRSDRDGDGQSFDVTERKTTVNIQLQREKSPRQKQSKPEQARSRRPPRSATPPTPRRPSSPVRGPSFPADDSFADFLNPQKKLPETRRDDDEDEGHYDDDHEKDLFESRSPTPMSPLEAAPPPMPSYGGYVPVKPSPGFATVEDEKQDLILKLYIQKKSNPEVRSFTMQSDIYEMRTELKKIEYEQSLSSSISSYREMLSMATAGLEWANRKYDPFDLALNGISDHMHMQQKRFDRVFARIHERYKNSFEMHPLVDLLVTYGGIVFMYHLTNKVASAIPIAGMAGMLNQRPDILQNMMSGLAQHTAQQPSAPPQAPQQATGPAPQPGGRREMRGPGAAAPSFDLRDLFDASNNISSSSGAPGGFMAPEELLPAGPPAPINFADPIPPKHATVQITEEVRTERKDPRPLTPVREDDRLSDVASEDLADLPDDLASVVSSRTDASGAVKNLNIRGGAPRGRGAGRKRKTVSKKVLVI